MKVRELLAALNEMNEDGNLDLNANLELAWELRKKAAKKIVKKTKALKISSPQKNYPMTRRHNTRTSARINKNHVT